MRRLHHHCPAVLRSDTPRSQRRHIPPMPRGEVLQGDGHVAVVEGTAVVFMSMRLCKWRRRYGEAVGGTAQVRSTPGGALIRKVPLL